MKYIKIDDDHRKSLLLINILNDDQQFIIKSSQFQPGLIIKIYDYSRIDGLPILELDESIDIDKITNIEAHIKSKEIDQIIVFHEIYPILSSGPGSILDQSNRYKSYQEKLVIITDFLFKMHNITKDMIEDSDVKQLIRDVKINCLA